MNVLAGNWPVVITVVAIYVMIAVCLVVNAASEPPHKRISPLWSSVFRAVIWPAIAVVLLVMGLWILVFG
jgi:hypothetical protein